MAKKIRKSKEYRKPSQYGQRPAPTVNPTTERTEAKAQSNAMILVSAGLVTSILLFVYYHFWTMGQLADLANGLPMPDQRAFGFTLGEVNDLRLAMDADATGQLAYVHRTVGLFFPLLFGFFSLLTLGQWVTKRRNRWLAWTAPMLFVIVDLWSNQAIDALFGTDIDASAVALASTLTVIRWLLLAITTLSILVIGVRRFIRTFKRKMTEAQEQNDA